MAHDVVQGRRFHYRPSETSSWHIIVPFGTWGEVRRRGAAQVDEKEAKVLSFSRHRQWLRIVKQGFARSAYGTKESAGMTDVGIRDGE